MKKEDKAVNLELHTALLALTASWLLSK
jgi:hypothetical protein